ncbi:MAG TPA: energy transducer TonB [Pyrinomonadaceae bacterium]|nr:energy transducer TonB [Pyrinomonadaceae bacterium]
MYKSRLLTIAAFLALALISSVVAQKPAAVDNSSTPKPAPAPQSVKAKYEGGVFGYNKKQEGTLNFDDPNHRLVFRNKVGKEVLYIPYTAISQEFADTQANRPKTASILGSVPVPYGVNPIGWIKTKNQYVTIQFFDEDSHVGGVTSFRVQNKEICASIVNTLADKAGLVARGEIFIKQGRSGSLARATAGGDMMVRTEMSDRPAVFVENELLSNRVISLPRPAYPDEARQQKVAGVVRVLVTVDETGGVAEAEAVSGSPMLQEAAVNAARQAKFEPLGRNGTATRMKTIIAYNFQLL